MEISDDRRLLRIMETALENDKNLTTLGLSELLEKDEDTLAKEGLLDYTMMLCYTNLLREIIDSE